MDDLRLVFIYMLKYVVNFIALLALTGCAINEIGSVRVRYFENETVLIISKESWGGYLSTNNADAGFILGHAERIFFYPKNNSSVELSIDEMLLKVQQDQFIETTVNNIDSVSDEAIAWITQNQGMMLHTNQFQLGVSLGFEAREVIRLPREFSGVFILRSVSDGKFKAYFFENSL